MWVAVWLAVGGVAGVIFARAAYTFRWGTKAVLGYALITASLVYLPFGIYYGRPLPWLACETLGIAVYVVIAFLGMRGSGWWLVIGWATHPFWNITLHHLGLGAGVGPYWLTVFSSAFDLMVAAMIIAYDGFSFAPTAS
ncbi:MAG TPA: hypothetical protein VKS22_14615 [Candidatus Binataceae bacterium]|nr:hypothetical protein [Candidatus Binataceae bacterium]